jgi:hypothetical protein
MRQADGQADARKSATAFGENPPSGHTTAPGERSTAPVFVLGSGRSGTKFLYDMLLSAGGFAVFHAESNAFNLLGPCFGNLAHRRNRRHLLDAYYTSGVFQLTGLDPKEIEERVMTDCRNAGDFLRIVMEAIARKQGVHRWAETTPPHLLYLPLIKKVIPDALVINIIRDGRDVTASMHRVGWISPLPWDRSRAFLARAIFWQWIVSKGRRYGQALGGDYLEVHYEDLVQNPRETLVRIGKFIEHDLDYDRIQQVALGTVHNPNSSFRGDGKETEANPIGRWKRLFTPSQVRDIESSIGNLLVDTGYALETPPAELRLSLPVRFMNFLYPLYFDSKLWLKSNTPLARIACKGTWRRRLRESHAKPEAR